MPNDKNIKSVERLTEKMSRAKSIYFTDYLGLNVSDITKLRKEFYDDIRIPVYPGYLFI